MSASSSKRLCLWQSRIETDVTILGAGPPLLWLHGPWGLAPDRDFLARLAATHTVFAPHHPGTSAGAPDAVHALNGWLDLVVYHGELMAALGLAAPVVAGHSFGGMVAAELAAASPASVAKLVLIDPVGLWRDDAPVRNWMILPDPERRTALFADPKGEAAERFFTPPGDEAARTDAAIALAWAQACTGKFVWPIPDRGLKNRIHRIAAPTLVVWGEKDGVVPRTYADLFAGRIAGARIAGIAGAGHLPHLERADAVAAAIGQFLTPQG